MHFELLLYKPSVVGVRYSRPFGGISRSSLSFLSESYFLMLWHRSVLFSLDRRHSQCVRQLRYYYCVKTENFDVYIRMKSVVSTVVAVVSKIVGCGRMLKSLVVNCSLDRRAKLAELVRAFKKFGECRSVQFRNIDANYEVGKDIDTVILSGSKARIVDKSQRDKFKHVTDLIKSLDLPLLGICYGHQLLCTSFGCEVDSLSQPIIDKFEEVHIVKNDGIFAGFGADENGFFFFESHNDYVKRNSLDTAGFVLLAASQTCEVEAVRHKSRPFYGVQFHPERIDIENDVRPCGHKLIENFYKNVVKQ